jgi:hypothetical protein
MKQKQNVLKGEDILRHLAVMHRKPFMPCYPSAGQCRYVTKSNKSSRSVEKFNILRFTVTNKNDNHEEDKSTLFRGSCSYHLL